jgi:hypothetical protein
MGVAWPACARCYAARMDEKTLLSTALGLTDNYQGHGGRGVATERAPWTTPETKACIEVALQNGYLSPLPGFDGRLIISDLGRQRLRALGAFRGTEWEHIRYTATPENER